MKKVKQGENTKTERNSKTWKENNAEKVQHGESGTWQKCNMKKPLREEIATQKKVQGKSATWRKCFMEKEKHKKSATWEEVKDWNSAIWTKYRDRVKFEKSTKEECTIIAQKMIFSIMVFFGNCGFGHISWRNP